MENKLAIKLRKFNRICPITGYREGTIRVGAPVIVHTDRGDEFGTIVSFHKNYPSDLNQDVRLKKVIRYATEEDLKTVANLDWLEDKAREIIIKKVNEYELLMKIIDIEYLFDTKKITIYYSTNKAQKNQDLKPFRKDLAGALNAELTMRNVTARDEAKFLGGLGPCGRPLCCYKWLGKPRHVTVKTVKEQGFPISPSKSSGMCGRLMCCFSYEAGESKP